MSMQPQDAVVVERGQRVHVRVPGIPDFATIRFVLPGDEPASWDLILVDDDDRRHEVNLQAGDTDTVRPLVSDGRGDSSRVLAAMWTQWMDAAAINAESSAMAFMPLKPYAHQTTAVYGAMLPQPQLRFLLADEPGTGKTIMAGLYIREMLPQYSQPYFATFWLDPWGFMLEAVCHDDRD